MAYDVFISYRRETGADDARLLQQALKARGFEVFFDYDSLRDGKFNEKIFEAIDEAPVFVLMLTAHSLERCVQEDDWVRREIERAMAKGCHVVPVAPTSQSWSFPAELPESLRDIPFEQVSELNKGQLFEESIDKIIENRFPEGLKGKCRKAGDAVSTVGRASEVFVGRGKELARLHELLAEGKFPVVTGPGGTGKSELVRQYAARYRAEYPGGMFQVDMETVRDWGEAFLGILMGGSNNGVKVKDYLEIEDEDPTGAQVRDALLKKAAESGPMLLVLDNVEGCQPLLGRAGGLTKAFPSGFSEQVVVKVVATARVCDVNLRPTDWGVEFPLGDLSRDDALTLLLGEPSEADAGERAAAERVAELLGYRTLYLLNIAALLGDLYSPYAKFVDLEKALKESLLETVGEGMEDAEDGGRTPSALWMMTRKTLSAQPGGGDWIRLAQIAAFCSPDGFPSHVLRHLWRDLAAPGKKEDRFFEQALLVLLKHGLLGGGEDVLSMHRLTRAAIQAEARGTWPEIEERMGASLANYPIMSQEDWRGFSGSMEIVRHIPSDMLNGQLVRWFLSRTPGFEAICPWEKLAGFDWAGLLGCRPQFSDKCPWEKLGGGAWSSLLCWQPQFADKCPWEKLEGDDWVSLLCWQPQFADKCPWEKLAGDDWVWLLWHRPQFADKCLWEKLSRDDWKRLLGVRPQFTDKCLWEKLEGGDWAKLLGQQPQFADKCSWEKLAGFDWAELLGQQPQFADKCPWEKLEGGAWAALLGRRPQFADKCPWEKLEGDDWAWLISGQPQFANKCSWEKLAGRDWGRLLWRRPQFADKCLWEKLEGDDWGILLGAQPQFADKCLWEKLEGDDWGILLGAQPQFADKCPWEKLAGNDWVILLGDYPQFADKCLWEKLEGDDWVILLGRQPQFADKCLWEKLAGFDWVRLLWDRPQFADKCPWEKLAGNDWVMLLRNQPQFVDKCPWEKLEGDDWVSLLCWQPQFADKCSWEKLAGDDWVWLLRNHPQFAEKRAEIARRQES